MRTLILMAGRLTFALCLTLGASKAMALCSLGSTSLSFGSIPAASMLPDILAGHVTVTCDTPSDTFTLAIDRGLHTGIGARQLQAIDGGGSLPYRLAVAPAGSDWGDSGCGDTFPAGTTVSGIGSQDVAVFGGIADSGSHVAPYTDAVTFGICNGTACGTTCSIDQQVPVTVSATIEADCRVASISSADFGPVTWNAPSIRIDNLATISLACAGDTAVKVGIGSGLHYDAVDGRRMENNGTFVRYTLQTTTGSEWGDSGLGGANTFPAPPVTLIPDGAIISLGIRGEAFPASATPGTYFDRVLVTIEY